MYTKRNGLIGTVLALLALLMVVATFALPAPASAQEQTTESSRKLLLELRGKPTNWFSFMIAEYYIDEVNQENGNLARDIMKSHLHGATWRFYSDNTLEFSAGTGMPFGLKKLYGTWENNKQSGTVDVFVGALGIEPNITLSAAGLGGSYDRGDGSITFGYAANYNRGGHWHFVGGLLTQDMTIIYERRP